MNEIEQLLKDVNVKKLNKEGLKLWEGLVQIRFKGYPKAVANKYIQDQLCFNKSIF